MPPKTISGYVDVPEADREAFKRELPKHSKLTNAEPGCQYFRVKVHTSIAGRYHVEEAFDDEAAYDAHVIRTRTTAWADATKNIRRSYDVK